MKASLLDCLTAFKKEVPNATTKLSSFCGVSPDTASRWNAKRLPKGDPLNKLWYLLDAYGYTVSDTTKLHPVVKLMGEALAYQVITAGELKLRLNLNGAEQYLWRVLQGKLLPLPIRNGELTLESLSDEAELLELAKEEAQQSGILTARAEGHRSVKPTSKPVPVPTEPSVMDCKKESGMSTVDNGASHNVDVTISILAASNMSSLKLLLEHIAQGGLPEIEYFREVVGDDTFWKVLDLLKSMASKKSYHFYQSNS